MRPKSFILLITILLTTVSIQAQRCRHSFDVEKHHMDQADYFAQELNLTDAEKKAFIPVMQEYVQARFDLNREVRNATRDLMRKRNRTSADYQRVIDLTLDAKIQEAELQKEYFKKMGKILPAEKLFKYNATERKFMQDTVTHHRRDRGQRGCR